MSDVAYSVYAAVGVDSSHDEWKTEAIFDSIDVAKYWIGKQSCPEDYVIEVYLISNSCTHEGNRTETILYPLGEDERREETT